MIELLSCSFISVTEITFRIIHIVKKWHEMQMKSSVPLDHALIKTPSTLSNIINDDDSLSIKKVENIDFMDLLII